VFEIYIRRCPLSLHVPTYPDIYDEDDKNSMTNNKHNFTDVLSM